MRFCGELAARLCGRRRRKNEKCLQSRRQRLAACGTRFVVRRLVLTINAVRRRGVAKFSNYLQLLKIF
jgi:hypothetical protein